jgi:hypothetical protein
MGELIADNQTTFIRGRCIQDNLLLVLEYAKALHVKKEASILLKVDIAKAFDSISWSFLLSVLRQQWFGARWIRWMVMLLRSASNTLWTHLLPLESQAIPFGNIQFKKKNI